MTAWTPEMDVVLRRGAARRAFARDIAADLVVAGFAGVTRNAVIGRAYRLDIALLSQPAAARKSSLERFNPDYKPKLRSAA